ncbi:MAG: YbaK/EbsC family protein [Vagococcus sp.]
MIKNLENLFKENDIYFELYDHEPIFTNEDAVIMKESKGFTGTETKSLFLKGKDKRYYIYFTFTTKQTDFKLLKRVVENKLSIVAPKDMEELTGQKAGAVCPFGYTFDVPLIIDNDIYQQEKLVFAPGKPDQTMVILVKDLPKIIDLLQLETYIAKEEA